MWSSIIAFLAVGIIVLSAGPVIVGAMPAKSEGKVSAPKSVNIQSPLNPAPLSKYIKRHDETQ